MRYMAIDYGDKHTGLAICDPSETIASPLAVIACPERTRPEHSRRSRGKGQKDLIKKIADIIKSENVDAIVLGLPLNMDDSQGPQAERVFRFAEQLKAHLQIPIHFQDERLTSFAADEKLAPAEFTRKKKKKRLDAIAAAEILEAFLEQKRT